MQRAEIRTFVEELLTLRGESVERVDGDLLHVTLTSDDPAAAGRERWLAFGARAYRAHPEGELVAVGSGFLDRLIGEATRSGRWAVAYRPVPARAKRPVPLADPPVIAGRPWGPPIPSYRPLMLFAYVVEYRTIDVTDDLILIAYDPATGEALPSAAPLLEFLRRGERQPVVGRWPLPALPTAADVYHSLDILDRRLQRRARKVKEASALEIARETANIEAYYRQLIDEVRRPVGRAQPSPEEESARVRLLQLDWKRRVQEVSRFWEARGDVRLSTVGVVMEPCWAMPLLGKSSRAARRRPEPPCLVANCRTGEVVRPRCALCGAPLRGGVDLMGKIMICESHPQHRAEGSESES